MKYSLLGYVVGTIAALYSVQLGDPNFVTKTHLETVSQHLAPGGFLPRHQQQPPQAPRGAHCYGSICQDASRSH
jgi:hypothetical protein